MRQQMFYQHCGNMPQSAKIGPPGHQVVSP
jgi:hypothetical protein